MFSEWLSSLIVDSGNMRLGSWELLLMTSDFMPRSNQRIDNASINDSHIIARAEVPVTLDRENVSVMAATPEIVIPNVGNMLPAVGGVLLMTPTLVAAAYYGRSMMSVGFPLEDRSGDLVVTFNQQCPALLSI